MASDWTKICLIDTENGSGELYSNLGAYNVITLQAPFSPERYIEAIKGAEDAGMEVIVIDSTSHEWDGKGGCLEINEGLARAKFRGNTWSAWSETTPRHQRFIEAIVSSPCHVITTARSKTDTIQTKEGDRTTVKKVGMKEIQRDGFEYELTVNFNLDRDGHLALASKDRTGLFIARDPFVINEETGKELLAWSDSGKEVPIDHTAEKRKVLFNLKRLGFTLAGTKEMQAAAAADIVEALTDLSLMEDTNLKAIVTKLEGFKEPESAQAVYAQFLADREGQTAPAPGEDVIQTAPQSADEISSEDIPF